jgi:hypothetical protein
VVFNTDTTCTFLLQSLDHSFCDETAHASLVVSTVLRGSKLSFLFFEAFAILNLS